MLKNGLFVLFVCFSAPVFAGLFGGDDEIEFEEVDSSVSVIDENAEPPLVQTFDIIGITLEATYPYIKSFVLPKSGYTVVDAETVIPELYKYNYEYTCRQKGAKTPKAIEGCIQGLAQKNKMSYLQKLKLKRFKTGEEVEIFFTSPLTKNLVYKVIYRNDANEIEGLQMTHVYQKNAKIRLFWDSVVEKYGNPNVSPASWFSDPSDPNQASMTAFYGKLKLENMALYAEDQAELKTSAHKEFQVKDYRF